MVLWFRGSCVCVWFETKLESMFGQIILQCAKQTARALHSDKKNRFADPRYMCGERLFASFLRNVLKTCIFLRPNLIKDWLATT